MPPGWAEQHRRAPAVSPAAMPRPVPPRVQPFIEPHRRDPRNDVRMIPAVQPADVVKRLPVQSLGEARAQVLGALAPRAWYEDPVALGSLLIMFPPIGLAALWTSKRYSSDARWALTVMTALTMCLGTAVVIAIVALRG
jgi:hypothetical protein